MLLSSFAFKAHSADPLLDSLSRPRCADPDDQKFYDAAPCWDALLVTGNKKRFPDDRKVLSPAEFFARRTASMHLDRFERRLRLSRSPSQCVHRQIAGCSFRQSLATAGRQPGRVVEFPGLIALDVRRRYSEHRFFVRNGANGLITALI